MRDIVTSHVDSNACEEDALIRWGHMNSIHLFQRRMNKHFRFVMGKCGKSWRRTFPAVTATRKTILQNVDWESGHFKQQTSNHDIGIFCEWTHWIWMWSEKYENLQGIWKLLQGTAREFLLLLSVDLAGEKDIKLFPQAPERANKCFWEQGGLPFVHANCSDLFIYTAWNNCIILTTTKRDKGSMKIP